MVSIFESLTFYLISLITAIFIGLYFYFIRNYKFWQKLGVPYVKPVPFVGNLKDCVFLKTTIGEQLQRIYAENSDKPYVGIFSFDKPSLVIRDLELVKDVLVKDFHTFMDRTLSADEKLEPLFANVLAVTRSQLWRHLRTNLTPVFTSGKMKKMFYLVDSCGKELADCLHKATADGSPVEVKETMGRFTTDIIASCAFGINSNTLKDPDAEFGRYVRNVFHFTVNKGLAILTAFFAPNLKSLFRLKFVDDKTTNYMRQTVWSTVEYREKHGLVRNDFLDCMMELRKRGEDEAEEDMQSAENVKKGPTFRIEGDLFVAQAFGFLAAGYETSATTLSFALYELALHPEIQHRLRAEILQVLNKHNGELTYDGIQEMSYLDRVVSETLRKYPIIPFLDRVCSSDYNLPAPTGNGTITLPAGTSVYIPVLALHHDLTYFPKPETFDPERFTEENKRSRPKYAYIPFGEGPRMCIGMRFALMQVKTGLCYILSRFEVAPCKHTPVPILFDPKSFVLVIDETLRKYQVLPFLDRVCSSDYKLPAPTGNGTITLPAGTSVYIPVLAIHHDPMYLRKPDKFDTDRFTEENKRSRPNFTYIQFGEGPRMCIGMRFALMQVKTGLCHILSRFEVAPCKDTPVSIVFDPKSFLLTPNGEIPLSFKQIKLSITFNGKSNLNY